MNVERVCDWRSTFQPECDHYEDLVRVNLANIGCSIIVAVILLVSLLIRIFRFKTRLLRPPPPSAPFWFWMDQNNAFLIVGVFHLIAKACFSASVLYTNISFYVAGGLYDLSYVIGFMAMTYYYMGTVIAIPNSKIVDRNGYQKILNVFKVGVPLIMFLAAIMPFLFGASYYLGLKSFKMSYNMETTLFAIWSFYLCVVLLAVNHLTHRLLKNIKASVEMETKSHNKEKSKSKLRKLYSQTKMTSHLFNFLGSGLMTSMIIFAAVRSYLWQTPWANILFSVGFNFMTTGLSLMHPIHLLWRDHNYRERKVKNLSTSSLSNSDKRESSHVNISGISGRVSSVEEQVMEDFLKASTENLKDKA